MLLKYGEDVRRGERALKAGLAPGAGSGGGWLPFWAAGAAWVVGADICTRARAAQGLMGPELIRALTRAHGELKNAA